MKLLILALVFIALMMGSMQISSQEETPPTIDTLDERISRLETTQGMLKWVFAAVGVLAGGLVAIQGAVSITQLRREGEREARQAQREEIRDKTELVGFKHVSEIMAIVHDTLESQLCREDERASRQAKYEKERDEAELAGVKHVSDIMGVVHDTLESRLDAEIRERDEKRALQEKVDEFDGFLRGLIKNIEQKRSIIEKAASNLAQTQRQDFRSKVNDLKSCAKLYDDYIMQLELFGVEMREFTQRVPYIRGIAAHYSNQPELADEHLSKVIKYKSPESDEDRVGCKRRVANAYYYLGIIKSNFGSYDDAIAYFNEIKKIDDGGQDLLTMVAESEARIMNKDEGLETAKEIIAEVNKKLKEKISGNLDLSSSDKRSLRWAALNMVSILMMEGNENWQKEAAQLLKDVEPKNYSNYYVTATLAQVYDDLGKKEDAKLLFRKAYEDISNSDDLITVKEVRTKILLLMMAGMCSKQLPDYENRSRDHLSKAEGLLDSLPKIDSQPCTVFSPLSKRNETSDTIRKHIELIRKGKVLLKPGEEIT